MDKKFCVKNLGCKVNAYESEFIISLFLLEGYKLVEENADVYIINTCTVTNESDKKSKRLINSIKKNNPDSIVIAMGCYTQNLYNTNKNIDINADIILGNKDKSKIIDYLNEYIKNKNQIVKFYDMSNQCFEDMEIEHLNNHKRGFIKIEDGCNNFCSYCIIPYVRGRVRSKSKVNVLKEATKLVKNNYKEIVLTGIHTGQYKDNEDYKLYNLLLDLIKIDGLNRIRISSIEIVEINKDIINLLSNPKIANHLHLPLQSGCDKILKLMNRRYDTKYFEDKLKEIRNKCPYISITTDVIVGFPGETEEDFKKTYNFCKKIEFSKIHVFPYSDRMGTVASKMTDKVDNGIKKDRVRRLMKLSDELKKKYEIKFVGKYLEVLIETYKDGYYYGHSSNYIEVKTKGNYELNSIYNIEYK